MQIQRFYLGCLAHASYLVHDGDEAAVIDPQRDVEIYLEAARARGVTIRWVIETHLHADFVSGHLELAGRTGATICIGAGSGAAFPHRALVDGDELPLGAGMLRAIATPGHTEEGVCIVAVDCERPDAPLAVFTGDTLFIGDVGRPDLSPTKTPQELAGMLFDSLYGKLLRLPDATQVFPAHGAGSLCGRQMSDEASSTIGKERRFNYALQAKTREEFVALLTADMAPKPEYFQSEVERNRAGAATLDELKPVAPLTPSEVLALQRAGATVLDTRPAAQFAAAHVPGSIHIGLSGQFASWAARLLGLGTRVVIVAEDDAALEEARLRLARVGIEDIGGTLTGGLLAWDAADLPTEAVDQISAHDAARWLETEHGATTVLDVRERGESSGGSVPGAIAMPLSELQGRLDEIERGPTVLVYCKSGYRSSIASSLLQAGQRVRVINIVGGYDAWVHAAGVHARNEVATR
jgi:glyoxylase-like metal-dependent hydrolase (beta-lactamase superfamily II)/rhodanese-related sulfurtransferase